MAQGKHLMTNIRIWVKGVFARTQMDLFAGLSFFGFRLSFIVHIVKAAYAVAPFFSVCFPLIMGLSCIAWAAQWNGACSIRSF